MYKDGGEGEGAGKKSHMICNACVNRKIMHDKVSTTNQVVLTGL